MSRRRGGAAPLLAILTFACGVLSPEEQLLKRFFEAARLNDTTAVAALSRVAFNPRSDGIVQDFDVQDVVDEGDGQKRVVVAAQVRSRDGNVSPRTLTVTMQRQQGRWVITSLR
jgi:hypothetical protein